MTENVTTGGIALWYTGCYINEEDACLLDEMNNNSDTFFETGTFPDSKAITVKNITVRLKNNVSVLMVLSFQKVKRRRTNGASKILGLSFLLDPTLHDLIDGISVPLFVRHVELFF